MAKDLNVPLRVLDIDISDDEATADNLIKENGDFEEDYIIPQVFLEYDRGLVNHLFTGFSEGVSVTEARLKSLLESRFYQRLTEMQGEAYEFLPNFVEEHMIFNVSCRGHCRAPASFQVLSKERGEVVAAYCCPDGFVSRVMYFSIRPDVNWFYRYLTNILGRKLVKRKDLRSATRYGWELDEEAATRLKVASLAFREHEPVIREIYWTRYPKTDEERSIGVFLCSGCGKLFIQKISSKCKLCPQCK